MSTNAERSEATRRALMAAARSLFVERGYAATGTPEIVATAAVTRGALYHHFRDKADLFLAVARQAAHEVAAAVDRGSARSRSPLEALIRGAAAYFAAMADQGRARLLLLEAPAVLDHETLQELYALAGEKELRQGLEELLRHKRGRKPPIAELTELLAAAFDRAALSIARGRPSKPYQSAIESLLRSLAR